MPKVPDDKRYKYNGQNRTYLAKYTGRILEYNTYRTSALVDWLTADGTVATSEWIAVSSLAEIKSNPEVQKVIDDLKSKVEAKAAELAALENAISALSAL